MRTNSDWLMYGLLVSVSTTCWRGAAPRPGPDAALFAYDARAPLDVIEHGRVAGDGYARIDLTFATAGGERVPAYRYDPAPATGAPAPAVVLLHGIPGSRRVWDELAAAYARAGVVALTFSAPWARPQSYRPFRLVQASLFDEHDRAEIVQCVRDARRALDYLETLPVVAPRRIGVIGHSAGGTIAAILMGVDPRVAAATLMAPSPGWVSALRHDLAERPEAFWLEPFQALDPPRRAGWIAAVEPLEAILWIGRARGTPLLVQGGADDRSVSTSDVQRLFAAASEPKQLWWYPLPHALGPDAFEDQARFLASRLGFSAERFSRPDRP